MDAAAVDFALQDVLERSSEFIGIDNEGLDFDQLEAFINSDATSQSAAGYFPETLPSSSGGKILNVVVGTEQTKRQQNGHSLPESPPDSSSEHPYSPPENTCDPPASENTLYSNLYKQQSTQPPSILGNNLILDSHIVVAEASLDNANILRDAQILLQEETNRGYAAEQPRRTDDHLLLYDEMPGAEAVYANLQNVPSKKRKLSQEVKSEPEHCAATAQGRCSSPNVNSVDDDFSASESCLDGNQYQCIRFGPFQQASWHALCDQSFTELPIPHYRVDADKGFNFSNADDAFVCQKKNHFQVTCHVQLLGDAQFVKTPKGFQKISSFRLHFYGVKHDCPTQTIRVEQSQSDRSKKPFHPVLLELIGTQVTKVTVGRLHFSETTSNNMRKKGKPNPEQRYFQLVVGLHAHTSHGDFPIVSSASQKIIVRASNPGQFENDVELIWQKGQTPDSVFHAGKVGVNTDRPDEALVVYGNLKITGHIVQPSDARAKRNIVDCDTRQQLRNVRRLRVVRYEYEPEVAGRLERGGGGGAGPPAAPSSAGGVDTGVIAQDVAEILPEAVSPAGDLVLDDGTSIDNFLVVNKERIFMENIGAVKELCKVTDNLETRIDQLEKINRRLNRLKRGDSLKSTSTTTSNTSHPRHIHTKRCYKHNSTADDELCSTKFIQIVIVVLILIMAFCLAAITALYLIETSAGRKAAPSQASFRTGHSHHSTNRPSSRTRDRNPSEDDRGWRDGADSEPGFGGNINGIRSGAVDSQLRDNRVEKTVESVPFDKEFSRTIGRPIDCLGNSENLNPCNMFCCVPNVADRSHIYKEKIANKHNKNKTVVVSPLEKNKLTKALYAYGLDKVRQKRDADDINDKENTYDGSTDETSLRITIQGKNFSTEITREYLVEEDTLGISNFTYEVPISKYMPDPFIKIIFRSHQQSVKVEKCQTSRLRTCPSASAIPDADAGNSYAGDKGGEVGSSSGPVLINDHTFAFEVDVSEAQSKVASYRHTQRQNQNVCKISASKVGVEFTEYNFRFYRLCDE